jgi:hypothetical protein
MKNWEANCQSNVLPAELQPHKTKYNLTENPPFINRSESAHALEALSPREKARYVSQNTLQKHDISQMAENF